MALEEYTGVVILEVDSQEIEIASFNVTEKTGRKAVKTMNRALRVKGFARGITTYELSVTAVIPLVGDIDWAGIEGAKMTIYPPDPGGKRVSYLDCFSEEVGDKYTVDNEAVRDIKLTAVRKVEE